MTDLRMTQTLNTFSFLAPVYRGDSQTSRDQPRVQVTQYKETGRTSWELDRDIEVFRVSKLCIVLVRFSAHSRNTVCPDSHSSFTLTSTPEPGQLILLKNFGPRSLLSWLISKRRP